MIVVVDPAQVVETEMAGQRCGFGRDTFHHAAVAADGINVVVEHVETGLVVPAGEPFLGDGHTDARSDALSEGASRGFHAGYPVIFRMPRSLAVELPEPADVIE